MKSFAALLGRITAIIWMALGGLFFAGWVVAAIIGLVVFLAAAVVCALPLCIGVLIQNWASVLDGRTPSFALDLSKFVLLLERDK